MTERVWLTAKNMSVLMGCDHIRHRERKLRLFACACAMNLTPWMTHPKACQAIERSYQFADGKLTRQTLAKWYRTLNELRQGVALADEERDPAAIAHWAARFTCLDSGDSPHANAWLTLVSYPAAFDLDFIDSMRQWGPKALRDIFANPFRPVEFDPAWRTSTAVALAKGMYGSRDFSPMPILADALQDAGCDSDDILAHCRDAKPAHVRGCWVIDLVLGKA